MATVLLASAASIALTPATAPHVYSRAALLVRKHALSAVEAPADDDACYLFDTDEGRKYVCTSNPEELAWFMGLDMKDLITGVKPDDLDLIECSEDWSHNGTPQWVCKEGKEDEDIQDGGCEMIGETPEEVWFACSDGKPDGDGVDCSVEEFGVGGGPGILPQDGEVLCKQKKPTAV